MKKLHRQAGFTIVELLIVIVVIGILVSITTVAYANVKGRADYARTKSDFTSIQQALELYKIDNSRYPISPDAFSGCEHGWCGWDQGTNDDFIPGLAPEYIATIPQTPENLPKTDTFLYQSSADGSEYQLLRYRAEGLHDAEIQDNPLLVTGSGYDGIAWGYKSNSSSPWW